MNTFIIEPIPENADKSSIEVATNTELKLPFNSTMKFGNLLAEIRKHKGLKQNELAKKANINVGVLSEIENNRREISLKSLKKIAEALEIPYQLLLLYTLDPTEMSGEKQSSYNKIVELINRDFFD